ncbi:unnamed protein product [Eruca vesicaria subsp. sativa]|uniref:Exostosin GT47 domain-containing protein n=1 Tax=Eruca vesicaria subsp. sativa TaxID=29727 RepID=A0ABC8ILC6_ERUVS|nr:unnamed protein product [Eruca vesicaria subsp. sativa]
MADLTCTTPFVLYPLLVIILFFYSLNHRTGFLSSVIDDEPSCRNLSSPSSPESSVLSTFRFFPLRSSSSCLNNSTSEDTVVDEAAERIEEGLAMARAAIKKAGEVDLRRRGDRRNSSDSRFAANGSIYLNAFTFHQSHKEMEKRFKIWAYREGEAPLFHKGPLNDIYAIEGHFMDEIENGKSRFAAASPEEATMFYIPVGIVNIIRFVYRPYITYSRDRLQNIVKDYISLVSDRYPYWNRSHGADHFFLSCHDWAPDVSAVDQELYKHFVRALCNANASEGFIPMRDVSLPEIKIKYDKLGLTHNGEPPHNRKLLAFFAGGSHGEVRKVLFKHWKGKDKDVLVYEYLPKSMSYTKLMDKAKFCLCPSGWEVASPRIVESLYSGCVPVIIADSYVLPFSDVLNWKMFSLHISVAKIPEIKKILEAITEEEYLEMQKRVLEVRKHFVVNRPSKPACSVYNGDDQDSVLLYPELLFSPLNKSLAMKAFDSSDVVSVREYKVKDSLSSTLQSIFDKYGDIASESKLQSLSTRTYHLEMLAEVVAELQSTPLRRLSESRAKEILEIVKDIETAKIRVSWLRSFLEEVVEATRFIKRHDTVAGDKEACEQGLVLAKQDMELSLKKLADKEKETREFRERLMKTTGKLGSLEMKRSCLDKRFEFLRSKVEKFQDQSVFMDIL